MPWPGLVWCTKCGRRMSGKTNGGQPVYVCDTYRASRGEKTCFRRVGAATLESFVKDEAISLLERLDVSGQHAASVLSEADHAAIEADRAEIAELKQNAADLLARRGYSPKLPTLVMAGRDDFAEPPEHQGQLAAGIPHARPQIIERAGHDPASERPAEVMAGHQELHLRGPAAA